MLNQKQKIAIFKELDTKASISMSLALQYLEENMQKLLEEKRNETDAAISEMKSEIRRLQLKDGYTPQKFVDYFTENEIAAIKQDILEEATPRYGEEYMTESDVATITEAVLAKIKLPENGVTPQAGKDYPSYDEVRAFVASTVSMMKPKDGNDGSPDTGEEIVQKINVLPTSPDKQIDASHIKNLPHFKEGDFVRRGGLGRGTSAPVMVSDLTAQCNGVLKTFVVPAHSRSLLVISTQFPVIFRPTTDFTTSGQTLTLTAEVGAPETSQTLLFMYVE